MSLTSNDLLDIRDIIESALTKQTNEAIMPVQGELEALRNDIKDIYEMINYKIIFPARDSRSLA